VPEKKIVNEF